MHKIILLILFKQYWRMLIIQIFKYNLLVEEAFIILRSSPNILNICNNKLVKERGFLWLLKEKGFIVLLLRYGFYLNHELYVDKADGCMYIKCRCGYNCVFMMIFGRWFKAKPSKASIFGGIWASIHRQKHSLKAVIILCTANISTHEHT